MTYAEFLKMVTEMHEINAQRYASMAISGKRIPIPRDNAPDVDTHWYYPKQHPEGRLPVIINTHGGCFTGCDAVQTGSLCQLFADKLNALAINVNYRKAPEAPFPYAIDEICDVVRYIAAHADKLNIEPSRIALSGESAGASLAAAVAMKLKDKKVNLRCQILIYPCTDLTNDYLPHPRSGDAWLDYSHRCYIGKANPHNPLICHLAAERELLEGLCPAVILTCENDTLREQGELYALHLVDAFVPGKRSIIYT